METLEVLLMETNYIEDIIKSNQYLYFIKDIDECKYEIPYKLNKTSKVNTKGNISLYNCITSKTETINISTCRSVRIDFKDKENHIEYNKKYIKNFKEKSKSKGESKNIPLMDFYRIDENGALMSFDLLQLLRLFNCKSISEVDGIDIEYIRDQWIQLIHEHLEAAKLELNNTNTRYLAEIEKHSPDSPEYMSWTEDLEEIKVIFDILDEVVDESREEVSSSTSWQDVINYWPAILLPKTIIV